MVSGRLDTVLIQEKGGKVKPKQGEWERQRRVGALSVFEFQNLCCFFVQCKDQVKWIHDVFDIISKIN